VLVVDGGPTFPDEPAPGPLASAEVFDAGAGGGLGAWELTSFPAVPRGGHSATALADGSVVVAGGYRAVVPVASGGQDATTIPADPTEVYTPAPHILSVTPGSGPVSSSTPVTLAGTGFTGATEVRFGALAAASLVVRSPVEVGAAAPARGTEGAVDVSMSNAGGTSAHIAPGLDPRFVYLAGTTEVGPPPPGIDTPCPDPTGTSPSPLVVYPARRYALIGLPAGTVVGSDSPLYGWFDLGAGGGYSVEPGDRPVSAGHGYWAWFACPHPVDLIAGGGDVATFDLGAYRATMVGNPAAGPAEVSGHDFAARWDPALGEGGGGYVMSAYRSPLALAAGEGAWAFSYVDSRIRVGPPG